MKKLLKIAAAIVAVLLLATIVVPLALQGKVSQIVKREANAMLNARLDFENLDISLLRHLPHASLELRGLTLVGIERFEGDTIVAANRISVVVNLISLFSDEGFEVTKIILDAPALHAHKRADGAVNWDIMKPTDEEPEEEKESPDVQTSAFRLSVRDFRIDKATIRYEDDSTRLHCSISPLSLRLRGDLSAEQTDLSLRLNARGLTVISGGIPMLNDAEAELKAVIAADLANNRYTLSDNTLRLNAIELGLDGWVELRDEALALDMKAACERVAFKDVLSLIPAFYTRDFRNLSAAGQLDLALWAKGEMREASLPAFELRFGVRDGSFQYSSLPKAVTDIQVAARIANPGGAMNRTEIDLSKCSLRMAGQSVAATFYATNIVSDPTFRTSVVGHVDLGAIKEVYPLEKGMDLDGEITADLKASGRMSDIGKQRYERITASGTFVVEGVDLAVENLPAIHIRRAAATITPQSMTLGDFGITAGRSDLTANGQLTGYLGYLLRGDALSGRLYVKSRLLDLNEIIEALPASETSAEPEAEAAAEPMQTLVIPKNLDLSLHTELHKVLFAEMSITELTGEMRMKGGALSLDKLKLRLFGGQASASGRYSSAENPARPQLKLQMNLTEASFAKTFEQTQLVQQLVPVFAKTGGDYSLSLNLSTAFGAGMSPELQSVDATGEIRSANIRVQNIEAFDALAKALKNDALRKIEAKNVAIRFAIRNGRVTTQPFDLKLGNTTVNLSGSTGLDQTIDYTARVSMPTKANGVLESLDVKIGGTFASPKITLGVKEAIEQAVQNVIDEQIQKLTGSESLSAEIEKQAANLRAEAQRAGEKLVSQAQQAGEKLVAEAQKQKDKLVTEAAKKGAIAKLAAEKAGEKIVAEAQKQAQKLTAEAQKQATKLTAEAEAKIEKLSSRNAE